MKHKNLTIGILFTATLFLGVSFFVWTVIPYTQMSSYFSQIKAFRAKEDIMLQQFEYAFGRQTYVQGELRNDLLDRIIDEYQKNEQTSLLNVLPSALGRLEEYLVVFNTNPKYFVTLAKGYGLQASLIEDNMEALRRAEGYYKTAQYLMPENPEIAYGYTVNLLNQKRFAEAEQLAKKALKEQGSINLSYQYLGLVYYRWGQGYYDSALEYLEQGIELQKSNGLKTLPEIYSTLFKYYYEKKDNTRFKIVINRIKELIPEQKEAFITLEKYIDQYNIIPLITIN